MSNPNNLIIVHSSVNSGSILHLDKSTGVQFWPVSHRWVSVFGATEKKALALLSEGSSSFLKWNWGFKREVFFNYTSHNQQGLIKSLRVRRFKPTKHHFWQCTLLQNHRSVEHFFMFSLKFLGKPDQSWLVKNVLFCRHKSRILKDNTHGFTLSLRQRSPALRPSHPALTSPPSSPPSDMKVCKVRKLDAFLKLFSRTVP